jgi:membrane associated rhomboid family serine protease/Zn-finger nucleic acid-binding protein
MLTPVCPRCATHLKSRTVKSVHKYDCPAHHGSAVEYSELQKILPDSELRGILVGAKDVPEGAAGCSHCRKPMKAVLRERGIHDLELDLCPRCRVLWLDLGEVHQLSVDTHNRFAVERESAREVAGWKVVVTLIGLPAEKDSDLFHRAPWITWAFLIACVAASVWGFNYPDYAIANFAHFSTHPFPWNIVTGLTSFFLHASWTHHLGKLKYLGLLIGATLAGDLLADVLDPRLAHTPGVGASGGIAGLIAYYLIRFPYRRFVVMIVFNIITIPALYFGFFYLLKEVVGAFTQIGGISSVSHLAHLGGALVGAALALFLRNRRPTPPA